MLRRFFPVVGKATVRPVLVLVSGVFTYLAFPGGPWPVLGWVCMVPWLAAASGVGPGWGVLLGLFYGVVYSLPGKWTGIFTAVSTLGVSEPLKVVVTILFFCPYIFSFIVFGFFQGFIIRKGPWETVWRSGVLTVLICWTPAVFPVSPAHMFHDQNLVLQAADIGGVPLLLFIQTLVNVLAADILVRLWHRRPLISPLVFLTAVICVVAAYGTWRLHEFQGLAERGEGGSVHIISIQPNIPARANLNALIRDNRTQVVSALELTRQMIGRHPEADLVAWPETPVEAPCDPDGKVFQRLSAFALQEDLPVLYQCVAGFDSDKGKQYYNIAQLVQADGSPGPVYRKRGLIPLFEYDISGKLPKFMRGILPEYGGFVPGKEAVVYEIAPGRVVIPAICYEIHYPEYIRDGVRRGGNIIVNIANDRRFGRSRIGYIDYIMSKFRTVEFRLPMVRISNSGPGAFIKATGETVEGSLTRPYRAAATSFPLFIPAHRSIYYRIGDAFLYTVTLLVLMGFFYRIIAGLMKKRTRSMGPLQTGHGLLSIPPPFSNEEPGAEYQR